MIHGSHVIVLPFPVQGHLSPMFQFCKRLASKGLTSTLVLVSDKPSPPYKTENNAITVFPIPSGSQEGKDPLQDLDDYIDRVYTSIKKHLPELIQDMKLLENPPRALVYDSTLPWLLDVAHDHGLRGASFFTQPWLVSVIYYHVHKGSFSVPSTKHGHSTLASFPAFPMLSANDLPSYVCESSSYPKILRIVVEQLSNIDRVDILLCNTFDNLEEKKRQSVVYVSFGSLVILKEDQMMELAEGLKQSGCFFLWVVRETEMNKIPKSYVEEIGEKGLFVSWSPQLEVLAHESVGCFLTHCGWNSTLEGLSLGVPMIGMPHWTDQPTNAKFMEDVWKVGVRVKAEADGFVRRDEIVRCVGEVMEREKGKEMRRNAEKWKVLALEAVSEGGSEWRNRIKRCRSSRSSVADLADQADQAEQEWIERNKSGSSGSGGTKHMFEW
ncbi:hypothetical protein YC2023_121570 [Brassica napus]